MVPGFGTRDQFRGLRGPVFMILGIRGFELVNFLWGNVIISGNGPVSRGSLRCLRSAIGNFVRLCVSDGYYARSKLILIDLFGSRFNL